MHIHIQGAQEHNLQGVNVEIGDGLTVVTGVSGSGKTSLVFDTLYHEARRRFLEVYALGSPKGRLTPANVVAVTGLGPAVAVGQNLLNRNPGSTLATAAGLHPFLRLLYAHFGVRGCPRCGLQVSVLTDDEIVVQLEYWAARTADANFAPRIFAPLLRSVPGSHSTLLAALVKLFGAERLWVDGREWVRGKELDVHRAHDIEVELEPTLSDNRTGEGRRDESKYRRVVRQSAALGVQAIVVRIPRPGGYPGRTDNEDGQVWEESHVLCRAPVCIQCGMWFDQLRPVDFNRSCPHCAGQGCPACNQTGLPPQAAAVRWMGLRLPELLALSVDEVEPYFETGEGIPPRLRQEIVRRLQSLQRVGLGYISLDRSSPTLSRGEAQRARLALTLIGSLEDILHVLDEPTVGLHPADVQRLLPVFRNLSGPVVFVEHERAAAAVADQAIDLGPGAGPQGGEVVFTGTPAGLWQADTVTGRYFSLRERVQCPAKRPAPGPFLTICGANLRNLQNIDVPIPLGRLTVITGVSGSGKSTLVEDVFVASLNNGSPTGCLAITLPPGVVLPKPVLVDQSPIGRNPRSNPATYTKLADLIRDLFAQQTGLSPSHFSFNRPEGACPACEGLGAIEVTMRYLPSTWIPCADCDGQRFNDTVLAARFAGINIADFYRLSIAQVRQFFAQDTHLPKNKLTAALSILDALCEIGLGYLSLGQPSPTLSGGEAQRVKLAKYLGQKSLEKEILILDEPSTGLHPQDLAGLLTVLDRLVSAGATVVIVEHNTDVMRAADWVIDLGPGAGPKGGRLLYAGPAEGLALVDSPTGNALLHEAALIPEPLPSGSSGRDARDRDAIRISGARVHNLQNVDVAFPKGKLTVVTGLSGSGKSSLVHDVLEAEARRRFLETLSLYERQGTREGPEAEVDTISGLGVALTIGAERLVYSRRATVGTATEISHHLAALLAAFGERKCPECSSRMTRIYPLHPPPGVIVSRTNSPADKMLWHCPTCGASAPLAAARHFSSSTYAAACLKCNGVGSLQTPNPAKLIRHPEKPLISGAMHSPGFFPNGYLGKPFNHGYYLVQALGQHYGFDPATTPWNEMTSEAQHAFLYGSEAVLTVHNESRTGRTNTHQSKFPGFYGFIRDWDVGGTYTDTKPCPVCGGARLRPEYLAVTLGGYNVHELSTMTLAALQTFLTQKRTANGGQRIMMEGSWRAIEARLHFLVSVGLGYLHLDRVAGTLSAGEAQRIRLASLLGSGLTALTLLLDEPTRGLHPCEVDALIGALARLRDEGNTVIVVEHDPQVMRAADWLIDMGPGAGSQGGRVVAQGTPASVGQADTLTGKWLRSSHRPHPDPDHGKSVRRGESSPALRPADVGAGNKFLTITGARAHNLKGETVRFPLKRLVGVCGVSGSGKSTLVIDTLGRALAPKKHTTSVAFEPLDPGEYEAIDGAPERVLLVDQSRAGLGSPASFLELVQPLQALYAESDDAQALGLTEKQLSTRCSVCGGSGMLTLDMAFLPDVHVSCETCRGAGYSLEAWDVRLKGLALPEAFGLTVDEALALFGEDERLARPLQAAHDVGLGYLILRQPGFALSGGEAQRLKIASELCREPRKPGTALRKKLPGMSLNVISNSLYILDEPSLGQHLEDVSRLAGVLRHLVQEGGSVIVVDHHIHLLAACDWLIELGPQGGPQGGYVITQGTPQEIAAGQTPTAPYLGEVL